ncbi:hypothetical protein BIY23_03505 [Wolbachia pipientis]|uniref:Uncharacterized protein n=1 Tax=Wolbachia pipientis TaxID=955 RepID=A0A1E7QJU0_WOLPI|nr:hypothetical protein [Wolbachia pipientis]OEY86474.1 hypothetical protein BIY23_03505 [Wolbachia pipientis]
MKGVAISHHDNIDNGKIMDKSLGIYYKMGITVSHHNNRNEISSEEFKKYKELGLPVVEYNNKNFLYNTINWKELLQEHPEYKFFSIKLGEGSNMQDSKCTENFKAIEDAKAEIGSDIEINLFYVPTMKSSTQMQLNNIYNTTSLIKFNKEANKLFICATTNPDLKGKEYSNINRAKMLHNLLTQLKNEEYNVVIHVRIENLAQGNDWDKYYGQDELDFSEFPLSISREEGRTVSTPDIEALTPQHWASKGKQPVYVEHDTWERNNQVIQQYFLPTKLLEEVGVRSAASNIQSKGGQDI